MNPHQAAELPPVVRAMLDHPIAERRSWLTTIGPAYLGVFIWVPFLDALAGVGSASPAAILAAVLAALACARLLYDAPARLGLASGERLPVVASAALGARGAEWIAGALYGLFGLVWAAVAISFSVEFVLRGLVACGLLAPSLFHHWVAYEVTLGTAPGGPRAATWYMPDSPLFLVCILFWTLIIASANGLRLVGVISALMKVYAPVAGLLLVVVASLAWSHQGSGPTGGSTSGQSSAPRIFQIVFGYFAYAGLMGVEWGAAARDRRDVRAGGWLGIVAAGSAAAVAALVLGASAAPAPGAGGIGWDAPPGSFRGAVSRALGATAGDKAAGVVLLLFGLAALAPACYGASIFTTRFRAHWPALRGWGGVGLFYAAILAMAATGIAARSEGLFALGGALFAPLAGVITADSIASRGRWAGVRPGWRISGVAAWAIGAAIGLLPILGAAGFSRPASIQPASLFAYLTAAIVYGASARRPTSADGVGDSG